LISNTSNDGGGSTDNHKGETRRKDMEDKTVVV
jgi:hypothetical protein